MKDILRPILELLVVLPGLLLGYFPVKTYLKQSPGRLAAWLFPLMACLCIGSGLACYRLHASTVFALAGVALAAVCLYTRTLTISLWKSGTIALSVCAVFACVNSLSRAVSAAIIRICSCRRTDRGSAWAPACSITPFAGSSCWPRIILRHIRCVRW